MIHEHRQVPPVKRTSPSPSPTNTIKADEENEPKNEVTEQCCKDNCQHRRVIAPPKEIPEINEVEPLKTDKKKYVVYFIKN